MNAYCFNPAAVASPLVNNFYKIYFADRSETVSLSKSEWELFIHFARSRDSFLLSELPQLPSYPSDQFSNHEQYSNFLLECGVILPVNENSDLTNASPSPSSLHLPISSTSSFRKNSSRLTFDSTPIFQAISVSSAESWLQFQLCTWRYFLGLFIFSLSLFYIGTSSANQLLLSTEFEALTNILRILLMFSIVNIFSVFALNVLKRSIRYNDYVIIFMLKWGVFPAFVTRLKPERISESCSQREGSIIFAQPILIRMYLCTFSMLSLSYISTFLAYIPPAVIILLRTLQQATILGIIFDCLPILNNSLIRLCIYNNFLQSDYLSRSFKYFSRNLIAIFKADFRSVSHLKFSLFFPFSLLIVSAKIFFIITSIVPNFTQSLPPFLGQSTSFVFSFLITILVIRFCITRLLPRLVGSSSVSDDKLTNSDFAADVLAKRKISPPSTPITKSLLVYPRNVVHFFRLRSRLIILLTIALVFPYSSTVSGTAIIVESQNVEIRSSNTGFITNVYFDGPSDNLVKQGSLLLRLDSELLNAEVLANEQDVQTFQSKINQIINEINSLKNGSDFQALENLDDEITSISSEILQTERSLTSLQKQLVLSDKALSNYKLLAEVGAVSTLQYESSLRDNILLRDQLSQASQRIVQLNSKLRIAKRSQRLGRGLARDERLTSLQESLLQARADLAKSTALQQRLNSERSKLDVQMPFDGVISSSTKSLLYRATLAGDPLLTVKALPLFTTQMLIPEYERFRIHEKMKVVVRLYANSSTEYQGTITSINPTTVVQGGINFVELNINLSNPIPSRFIGSSGNGKIILGYSCLANDIARPIIMFFRIDAWKYFPWA